MKDVHEKEASRKYFNETVEKMTRSSLTRYSQNLDLPI
jgi:hypothetical protein